MAEFNSMSCSFFIWLSKIRPSEIVVSGKRRFDAYCVRTKKAKREETPRVTWAKKEKLWDKLELDKMKYFVKTHNTPNNKSTGDPI